MIATGPGSISRQSIGTAVVGGLAFATITIVFVPIFFVIIERLRGGTAGRGKDDTVTVDPASMTAGS